MPWSRQRTLVVAGILLAAGVEGCSGGGNGSGVSGTITYQGKAVVGGVINFLPAKGRPLGGGIGSDGTYKCQLPEGEYKVLVDAPAPLPPGWKDGDPMPPASARLAPQKYASFQSSGLSASVKSDGPQKIDFELP